MDFLDELIQRNSRFAQAAFCADLQIIPSRRTLIIGCVDPRVDPVDVLGLEPGEAAVIRNVGGRVNPALLETLAILRSVSRVAGNEVGQGWQLIVLQHTDCGISGCYQHDPALLARHMGVSEAELPALQINDPYQAVAVDIAALRANPRMPGGFIVTGLVYDVATGRIDTVVPGALLRAE